MSEMSKKNKLYKLIEHVGIEYIFVAEKIVHYAESNLEKKTQSIATTDSC